MPALLPAASLLLGVGLTLLALAVTAFVLGRILTGELDRAVERWAIPTTLGLAALAHLGFVLGLAGLFRPQAVLLVVAGIHLLGFRVWRAGWRELKPGSRRRVRPALLGALALLPLALLTLYPPTAFDATLYHLPFARAFVASGGLPFLADLRFPVFPQATEMLFAWVLLWAPKVSDVADVADVAAQGVSWLMTMLTAALLGAWARDSFKTPAAGWLAAALYLGNPIVVYLAGIGYVDAGLTLFVTAALYAARRFRGSGERRWLVLAAVFAATAADTKYLGLFFVGAIGLAVLFGRQAPGRIRSARALRSGLLFAGIAALVLAPWYGRILAWTGNPLFPYFPRVFGSSPWAPTRFRSLLAGREGWGLLASRGVDLVRLPWDLVWRSGRYGSQPPYSPLYLALLPLALVAAGRDSRQRRLLALAAVYAFVCLGLPPDARYMTPALPLVSLSAAGALTALLGRFPRRGELWAAGLCVSCFLPGWLYALYRLHHLGPLPLTPAARETYLARWQPCYPAVAALNRTLGSGYTVWALHAENLTYYARGRFLGDWVGPARFDRVLQGLQGLQGPEGPRDLHDRLRRLKVGYLLVPRGMGEASRLPFPEDALVPCGFQPVYADAAARVYKLQ